MWFSERYTLSRGRCSVPCIFLRMRSCTWPRFWFFEILVSMKPVLGRLPRTSDASQLFKFLNTVARSTIRRTTNGHDQRLLLRSGLSDFLLQALAGIAHALILVWIRRTQRTHFCGDLTYLLTVNSRNCD